MIPDKKDQISGVSNSLTIGYTLVGGMVFFGIGGFYLDKRLETNNIITLVGIFLGLLFCGYEIWKIVRTADKE